jgi:DNA-binding NarL/FixJ family response regulator
MSGQSIRVLIVDELLPTRKGMEALLTLIPEVEVVGLAMNGREAVQIVKEFHPDVVLMGIQMPVLDGLDATRQIKSSWPDIRVIILTMYTTYHPEALAAGADGYLIKGCDANMLLQSVLNTSLVGSPNEMFNTNVGEM